MCAIYLVRVGIIRDEMKSLFTNGGNQSRVDTMIHCLLLRMSQNFLILIWKQMLEGFAMETVSVSLT